MSCEQGSWLSDELGLKIHNKYVENWIIMQINSF